MRHYLQTIHTRSDTHKKRFALLTSTGITLLIFAVWGLVRFSPFSSSEVVATNAVNVPENVNTANAITPIGNIISGISESFQTLKDQFNAVKGNVQGVNIQSEYDKMRSDALKATPTSTQ